MEKKLKFVAELVPKVLSGEKRSTWRLWDDKDLTEGDMVDFYETETGDHFAVARLTAVLEKPMSEITDEDFADHERYPTPEEMYRSYQEYYQREVTPETLVKIVNFELLDPKIK